jgi:hypothetical protein
MYNGKFFFKINALVDEILPKNNEVSHKKLGKLALNNRILLKTNFI